MKSKTIIVSGLLIVAAVYYFLWSTNSGRWPTDLPQKVVTHDLVQASAADGHHAGKAVSRFQTHPSMPVYVAQQQSKASVIADVFAQGQSFEIDLRQGVARYGNSDGRVTAVYEQAKRLCESDPFTQIVASNGYVDPTRAWAATRIRELCDGFDKDQFALNPPAPSDAATASAVPGNRESLPALAAANRALSDGWDRLSLFDAGIYLLSMRRFPFSEVAPGADRQFGLFDQELAWDLAVDLAVCNQLGGCGPESPAVARYCVEHGCPPGSSLAQAYEWNLPAAKYALVLAFANWIRQQRTHVP